MLIYMVLIDLLATDFLGSQMQSKRLTVLPFILLLLNLRLFPGRKKVLISKLRKELRVTDMGHRALLGKVNKDDVLKNIRECQ